MSGTSIEKKIKAVAKELDIHPSQVTQAQLLKAGDVTEWQLRKLGGLAAIKKAHFPMVDKDLLTIQSQKDVSKYINKLEKDVANRQLFEERLQREMGEAIGRLSLKKYTPPVVKRSKSKREMTMELMLSDIHYGLKSKEFNLSVCRARIQHAVSVFLKELEDNDKLFNVERIILAVLGDIIQSYTMHGVESALSSEFSNPRQIDEAIESLYFDVLIPLSQTGRRIDFVGVTGNHDRYDPKRTMNYPGLNNVTWVIYKGLQRLAKISGLTNIKFHIPEECYVILPIYNNNCLYEHGDNTAANTKAAFETKLKDRGKQTNQIVHFGRFGHYHEYQCFGHGLIIVNESVCGQDSYSETMGFTTTAGQTINYYIQTDVRPNCFYKSFPVYLGHIGGKK